MDTAAAAKARRELIAFYLDAGVNAAIGEAPIDRFADEAGSQTAKAIAGLGEEASAKQPQADKLESSLAVPVNGGWAVPKQPSTPASPEAAVMAAREVAKSAPTLEALRALLERFEGCMLRATATQLVFADGNPKSRVMFVGEAPGRDEDIAGLPFVGRSGKLLDLMMAAIGLDRSKAYIANIVPWRPPGNRTPTPQESAICLPFILRQIELADPDVLVCLGQPSTQTLLGTKEGITRTRGRWFKFNTGRREIRALPTYHPAFLLRSPLQKRLAWRDFLALQKTLS